MADRYEFSMMRFVQSIRDELDEGVEVTAQEFVMRSSIEVWLSASWRRRRRKWWRARQLALASSRAAQDAPVGVLVRVAWR